MTQVAPHGEGGGGGVMGVGLGSVHRYSRINQS